jgi:hypothetical protein
MRATELGLGPWFNAKGEQVASGVDDLHDRANRLTALTALDEHGRVVPGAIHDILTGSHPDGTVSPDATCSNWTSTTGRAVVGHHNRSGSCCAGRETSWSSAHESRGCTLSALQAMGSDARIYCFASD